MNYQNNDMCINVDVLIAGSGVSGLYCALNLRSDINVLVISKSKFTDTNTYLAQGGISTARNVEDIPLFIEDTLNAGQHRNKLDAVRILAEESIDNINKIIEYGVQLDKNGDELVYTREGAHTINRIVHSKDTTGKALADALLGAVKERKNITLYENTYLADILTKDNVCTGGVIFRNNEAVKINAKAVVLATGGIGGVFKNSTNQRALTGDGMAIALRHNVKLKDVNYIQIHPTALYEADTEGRRLLISEAVRGEGGRLYNVKGQRFVDELLPRDVVSKAIFQEIKKSGVPYVKLDISFANKEYLKNRFPFIYKECLNRGYDITKEPIPISPAQHYYMGGIDVDYNSRTSMENLFAVGEASCTGVHGANRLASNSLLEGLVFSKRAAIVINNTVDNTNIIETEGTEISTDIETLQKENKRMVIEELKRRSNDLDDELFYNR